MPFGERKPILVSHPVAMPVTKGAVRDARISGNLGDCSTLEIGCRELLEDVVDVGVVIDMMLAFHDSPECRDHREDEIVNGQSHKPRI
jgi:hypothetical protein